MSANPTLIQTDPDPPRDPASVSANPSPHLRHLLGSDFERSDAVANPAPVLTRAPPVVPPTSTNDISPTSLSHFNDTVAINTKRTRMLDSKGKGKQKDFEEKEEGEISDEDEEYVIRDVDSWRPSPSSSKKARVHSPRIAAGGPERQSSFEPYERKNARGPSQAPVIRPPSKTHSERSVSRSPTVQRSFQPSPTSHRLSVVSDTNTTTSSTPSSDSLALPESEPILENWPDLTMQLIIQASIRMRPLSIWTSSVISLPMGYPQTY